VDVSIDIYPPITRKAVHLAPWLANNISSVRSLCVNTGCWWFYGNWKSTIAPRTACEQDMSSIAAALVLKQSPPAPMPHLVKLDIPILGGPGTNTALALLASCPSLQHLALHRGPWEKFHVDPVQLAAALAPLKQLRTLQVAECLSLRGHHHTVPCNQDGEPPGHPLYRNPALEGLLRQLPSSLEDIHLQDEDPTSSDIPLSCISHLINLRQWEYPGVRLVLDDCSSCNSSSGCGTTSISGGGNSTSSSGGGNSTSSSGGGGNSTSSSGGGNSTSSSGGGGDSSKRGDGSRAATCSITALTALTRLVLKGELHSADVRLKLPNLCCLHTDAYQGVAWECLHGLRTLVIDTDDDIVWNCDVNVAGLGTLTNMEHLTLPLEASAFVWGRAPEQLQPWMAATAKLTKLKSLQLTAYMALAGGASGLTTLTQLEALTVHCTCGDELENFLPDGAKGWAASPAGAVVELLAAAVGTGWRPLQRLVLVVPSRDVCWQVGAAARAALPGLQVEVQHE
jgi:hypothetical protein